MPTNTSLTIIYRRIFSTTFGPKRIKCWTNKLNYSSCNSIPQHLYNILASIQLYYITSIQQLYRCYMNLLAELINYNFDIFFSPFFYFSFFYVSIIRSELLSVSIFTILLIFLIPGWESNPCPFDRACMLR